MTFNQIKATGQMFEIYKINQKDVCHQISIQELFWNKKV